MFAITVLLPAASGYAAVIQVPGDFPTIQLGLDAASSGDTVQVAPGVYEERIVMKAGVVLSGSGWGQTVIDGLFKRNANGSVVVGAEGSTIAGFTIRNANLEPFNNLGACIDGNNASFTIRDNRISTCRIGIWAGFGNVTIERNVIIHNRGHSGVTMSGPSLLRNNTLVDNGRGIQLNSTAPTVVNNVVVGNVAGIIGFAGPTGYTIRYNDVFGNTSNYTNVADQTGVSGNISSDPLFADAMAGDYRLVAGSLCIDSGDPTTPPDPDGTVSDMGAFFELALAWQDLVIDFGTSDGLWIRHRTAWRFLHNLSPEAMVTGDLDGNFVDDLVVDFGTGIGVYAWMNHATWQYIHFSSPSQMVTGDLDDTGQDDVVFDFPGFGLWLFNNNASWAPLHGLSASRLAVGDLDGTDGEELLVSFAGAGLFVYSHTSGWALIHGFDVNKLLTADLDGNGQDDVVIAFPFGLGLWAYLNQSTWTQVHPFGPAHVASGDIDGSGAADLVIDFGVPYGLWMFRNNTTWALLHGLSAEAIVLADRDATGKDEIVVDFGPADGLWQYGNDSTWEMVVPQSPEAVVSGRFH